MHIMRIPLDVGASLPQVPSKDVETASTAAGADMPAAEGDKMTGGFVPNHLAHTIHARQSVHCQA